MANRIRRDAPDRGGLIYKALRSAIIEHALVPVPSCPKTPSANGSA
jgi:hypothetical protein